MGDDVRVTVWNEFLHEKRDPRVAEIYPKGIHSVIAEYLEKEYGFEVRTATIEEPEHGLTEEALNNTDVLIWWGHLAHEKVRDDVVDRIYRRIVLEGMGLIVLHSAHYSKIFKRLMGTTCSLKWREAGERERLWVVAPGHPIAEGIGDYFEIEHTEMYGEPFDIPPPDELVFISWFKGGEVFRSGCCFYRGMGKIFYFRPGHETLPIYHNPNVLRVIGNAVWWARPVKRPKPRFGNVKPLEKL
ncbi:trehalose utilization protein ThuA [Candidatus Bathyarchaeota archaeon]|nr:MAG: trehalose utilization protein ThuA [Candidatus Bathyarchaeota archaeon]